MLRKGRTRILYHLVPSPFGRLCMGMDFLHASLNLGTKIQWSSGPTKLGTRSQINYGHFVTWYDLLDMFGWKRNVCSENRFQIYLPWPVCNSASQGTRVAPAASFLMVLRKAETGFEASSLKRRDSPSPSPSSSSSSHFISLHHQITSFKSSHSSARVLNSSSQSNCCTCYKV